MGDVTNTVGYIEGGNPTPVSRGGASFRRLIGTVSLNSSYATGGDSLVVPTITGASLYAVNVIDGDAADGTYKVVWNKSTSTPKLIKLDEDGTSGIHAEDAATGDNSAIDVIVELIYKQTPA